MLKNSLLLQTTASFWGGAKNGNLLFVQKVAVQIMTMPCLCRKCRRDVVFVVPTAAVSQTWWVCMYVCMYVRMHLHACNMLCEIWYMCTFVHMHTHTHSLTHSLTHVVVASITQRRIWDLVSMLVYIAANICAMCVCVCMNKTYMVLMHTCTRECVQAMRVRVYVCMSYKRAYTYAHASIPAWLQWTHPGPSEVSHPAAI